MATQLDAVIRLKDNFSKTLESIDRKTQDFQRTAQRMGRDVWQTGKTMTNVGSSLTKGLTVPIVGVGMAAGKLGMDFEKTMSGVAAVTGATGNELETLELKAREMGKNTTKSSSEAAQAMEYMGLAGWETSQIISGIEPVLRLSEAGNIDLARASDLVTDSMSAMGIEVQELDGYLDIVAQTARSSNTDVDAMMEAYLGVGGVLRGLNVPLEESAVSLGMLANAGIKGGESGKSLSAILTNLTAPTGRAKKALDDLGFSAFDSQGEFKGLDNILFELKDGLSGMDTEQQNMVKSMIAGKEHTKGLNALLNGLDDSYEELSGSIGEADGALMTMADIMNDNTAGSISRLLSSLQEVGLSIYDTLRPGIVEIIDKLQGFADKLNDLSPAQKETIVRIAKMAAVIGPLLLVVGKLTTGVSGVIFFFSDFARKATKMGGVLKALTSPGMLVAGAFIALIAIGILLYKNWDKIKAKAEEIFPGIGEKISSVIETVKTTISTGLEFIRQFWETHGTAIMETISLMWEFISTIFTTAMEFVGSVISVGVGIIQGLWSMFGETIMSITSIAWDTISAVIGGAMDIIQGLINVVLGIIQGDWSRVWEGIQQIFEGVMTAISAAWNGAKEIIGTVIEGVVEALTDKFHSAVEKAREAWEGLKTFLKNPIKGTINLAKKGAGWAADKLGIGNNYKGTDNWRGGPTWVHEKGAEIIDLPKGSRVYPHDKSLAMAKSEGRQEGKGNTITIAKLADQIVVREDADIDKLAKAFARELEDVAFNTA